MGLRGDTLRLGLLPPLRGGRLAWPAPRAWDYPNPALPPYDVKTPHTWSPAYGGYIGRRAYLQDGLCVYLCVWHRTTPQEASAMEFWPHRGASETPRSEEASIWINFNQKSGPALQASSSKSEISTNFEIFGPRSPEATCPECWPEGGPKSEEASIWIKFDQKSGPAFRASSSKSDFLNKI